MSLFRNPMLLYPGPYSWSGTVSNDSSEVSVAPWTVIAVVTPSGRFLSNSRWSISVVPNGTQNDATITLAAGSTEEQAVLSSGGNLFLAVKYTNNNVPDILIVGMA